MQDQPVVHLLPLNLGSDFSSPESVYRYENPNIYEEDSSVRDQLNISQESIARFSPLESDQSTSSSRMTDISRQSILSTPGPILAPRRPKTGGGVAAARRVLTLG